MPRASLMVPLMAAVCAPALWLLFAANDAQGATNASRKAAAEPKSAGPGATIIPGGLVRWSAPGTSSCRIGGRTWKPLEETCYFPFDVRHKPGVVTVTRVGAHGTESARVKVEAHDYGTQEVELPDIPQRNPSSADMKRAVREGNLISKATTRPEGPPLFTLPLAPVVKPMPPGKAFGVARVFNGKPAPQPHMGIDYAAGPGTPVLAVADGTVVLAQDLFFPGNAVFVDHGNGLVTEAFHLAEMAVQRGDVVKKGQELGKVGTTGRSTGPHLFFGTRWHGSRINPRLLFEDPSKIVAIH